MTSRAKRRRVQRAATETEELKKTPGTSPGTLLAPTDALPPAVHVMAYSATDLVEFDRVDLATLKDLRARYPVVWINVDGLGDVDLIRSLGEQFALHPLALEDILHVNQRAKLETYDGFVYLVLRMMELEARLTHEQVSLLVGPGFCLTFQETEGDCLDPVRRRLRAASGRIRKSDAGYLAYALIDAIVDHYFPVLEGYGERIELLEDETLAQPDRGTIARIHQAKRELLALRRAVWPLREALNTLVRDEVPYFSDETRVYLRDCYDHAVRVIDIVETYRELASSLVDIYLSSLSNRMNEVMKVLTIISTIFIPLSFIAGVYGMNFDPARSPWNMPELGWRYGYLASLCLMGGVAGCLVVFFYRRGWLGRDEPTALDLAGAPSEAGDDAAARTSRR